MSHDDQAPEARHDTARSGPLTDVERQVLEFARLQWRHQGAKESAVLEWFGWTLTRYHAILHALLQRPEALAYDATTVNRLRRLAEKRRQVRTVGAGAAGLPTAPDARGTRPMLPLPSSRR